MLEPWLHAIMRSDRLLSLTGVKHVMSIGLVLPLKLSGILCRLPSSLSLGQTNDGNMLLEQGETVRKLIIYK